jgi:cell wall-associated NlpC family hydrolase
LYCVERRVEMSSPAVVFLRNGLISALAALAIWLLPFLLRDDPAKRAGPQDVSDLEPDGSDLRQASTVAALPEKTAGSKEPPSAAKIEAKVLPQPVIVPPPAVGTTLPTPTPTQARINLRPGPAAADLDSSLSTPALNDTYAQKPLPSPVQPAVLTPPSEPESHAAASPAFAATPAVLAAPPVPDRHPRRLSFLDELAPEVEPRTIQAAVHQRADIRAASAPVSPIAYLTRLLRPREQARPAPVSEATGSIVPVSAHAAATSASPLPAATASQPRTAPERWKPASCDDNSKFWK